MDLKRNSLISISLLILILGSTTTDAEIVKQPRAPESLKSLPSALVKEKNCQEATSKSVLSGFKKFVLLTTGDQVKLQPLKDNETPSEDFYFIKVVESTHDFDFLTTANHRRRTKHILPKGLSRKTSQERTSIIPADNRYDDRQRVFFRSARDYWISDVNYLFGSRYCSESDMHSPDECMVIAYLDSKRQSISYASIDLRLESPGSHEYKTLYGIERESIRLPDLKESYVITANSGLAVDRKRRELYTNLESDDGVVALLAKLKLKLTSENESAEWYVDELNPCRPAIRMQNLNIDDSNGNWLFYSNHKIRYPEHISRSSSSLIGAINLRSRNSSYMHTIVSSDYVHHPKSFGMTGFAPDVISRKIYWFTENQYLMSCEFAGYHLGKVMKSKSDIYHPGRTEVVQKTFYISDSKRTLFYYKPAVHDEDFKLLLEEKNLENFRVGYVDFLNPICNSSSGQDHESNSTKIDAIESKQSSLQTLMGYVADSLVGDIYDTWEEEANIYCKGGARLLEPITLMQRLGIGAMIFFGSIALILMFARLYVLACKLLDKLLGRLLETKQVKDNMLV